MFKTTGTFSDDSDPSTFFCDVSLVHNDTFVDLIQSDITCSVKGTFLRGILAENTLSSATGYVFHITYAIRLRKTKNIQFPSDIATAMISKIFS